MLGLWQFTKVIIERLVFAGRFSQTSYFAIVIFWKCNTSKLEFKFFEGEAEADRHGRSNHFWAQGLRQERVRIIRYIINLMKTESYIMLQGRQLYQIRYHMLRATSYLILHAKNQNIFHTTRCELRIQYHIVYVHVSGCQESKKQSPLEQVATTHR